MRRRAAIIGTVAGAALLGGVLLAPNAQADPSVCVDLDVSVNGQGAVESICLPGEGAPAPEAPELPEAPALPGL
jgi:hypothetical protein